MYRHHEEQTPTINYSAPIIINFNDVHFVFAFLILIKNVVCLANTNY